MNPTVIPIFLSMEQSQCVEMPITPTTTAFDVIESCKEAGATFILSFFFHNIKTCSLLFLNSSAELIKN